jgi:hypothetical protein
MIYNIPPSTNITNLFGYLLNGMSKKDKGHVRVGMCDYYGSYGLSNDFIFNGRRFASFLQSFGYTWDPYVILSPVGRAAPRHRYWVQPFNDGSIGFLRLV